VLEQIRETYLGQSINEFLESGGDAREYARLVFNGEIFGPGEDPADPDLGILTADDLAEALEQLIEQRNAARAAQLKALAENREGTQFKPLDPDSPTVRLEVRAPASLVARVAAEADARSLTRSDVVRLALQAWLDEHE